MKELILEPEEILRSYDVVSELYPHVPSLSHWRSWEHAAYRHFALDGRTLDVGCGDGRYFRLIWPDLADVVGVEIDPAVARLGEESGVYRAIHVGPADRVSESASSFDHAFANCSLEHMDRLDAVLAEINRCLKPGGTLVCSVVTNRYVDWALLPHLIASAGHPDAALRLHRDFMAFHHLANLLSVEQWAAHFEQAGFDTEVHVPILPEVNSGIFLLTEGVWHAPGKDGGELGTMVHGYLSANPRFPAAFRKIFAGLLDMETDWRDCSGAVFQVRKVRDAR
jgi:SAM-dependent methyltransferase